MNPLNHFIKRDTHSRNEIKIGDTVTINPKDTRDIPRHKGMKGIVYKEYPGDPNRVYVRIKGTGYAYNKDDLE
jgi:hypothetical protein